MLKCCFAGHRVVLESVITEVRHAVEKVVLSSDSVEFYSGSMGEFDSLCEQAVREMQKKYKEKTIRLYRVLPSYQYVPKKDDEFIKNLYDDIFVCDASDGAHPKAMIGKRNRWMADQSDIMIAYVKYQRGGAYESLRYAQKQNLQIIRIDAN